MPANYSPIMPDNNFPLTDYEYDQIKLFLDSINRLRPGRVFLSLRPFEKGEGIYKGEWIHASLNRYTHLQIRAAFVDGAGEIHGLTQYEENDKAHRPTDSTRELLLKLDDRLEQMQIRKIEGDISLLIGGGGEVSKSKYSVSLDSLPILARWILRRSFIFVSVVVVKPSITCA